MPVRQPWHLRWVPDVTHPPSLDGAIHRSVIRVGTGEYVRDVGCSGTKLRTFMHKPDPDEPGWTEKLAGIGMCAAPIKSYMGETSITTLLWLLSLTSRRTWGTCMRKRKASPCLRHSTPAMSATFLSCSRATAASRCTKMLRISTAPRSSSGFRRFRGPTLWAYGAADREASNR